MTNIKNRTIKNRNKSLWLWIVSAFAVAVLVDTKISHAFMCLNYLYGTIKYTILVLLFVFCYYGIKQTIEKSIIIPFLTWSVLNCLSYWGMLYYSQKNECFITPPCKVTSYIKETGKSQYFGINYIYKGEKHHLYYTNKQLDSLADAGEKNWGDKIDLRLKLNKVCESIYYINDFYVTIKK